MSSSPRSRARTTIVRVLATLRHVLTTVAVVASVGTVLALAVVNHQGNKVLIVSSGSMTPTFRAGDAVVVEALPPGALRAGMVVSFAPPGASDRLTTHRIHDVVRKPYGLFLRTKGDANKTPDPDLVPIGNVRGVLTQRIPGAGRWLAFYESPRGRAAVLGTPLLLLLLSQGLAFVRDLGRLRNGKRPSTHLGLNTAQGAWPGDAEAMPRTRRERRERREAASTGPGQRFVAGSVLAVCAIGAVVGVGVARRTHALYTNATPVAANTLSTRAYCPNAAAYGEAVAADKPVLWYRLEESSGTAAVDSSSAPVSGTFVGGVAGFGARGALRCDERSTGVPRTAVSFDGVDDYLTAGTNDNSAKWEPVSVEAWFLTAPGSQGGLIVGRCNQNGQRDSDRVLYLTPRGQVGFGVGTPTSGQLLLTTGPSLADGQWHHVVGTANGSRMTLYVDGITIPSLTRTYTSANNGLGTWQVGWDDPADLGPWTDSPGGQHFKGTLDEVAIYQSVLGADRVADHWSQAHYKP